jgi:hypothetical protein
MTARNREGPASTSKGRSGVIDPSRLGGDSDLAVGGAQSDQGAGDVQCFGSAGV